MCLVKFIMFDEYTVGSEYNMKVDERLDIIISEDDGSHEVSNGKSNEINFCYGNICI